MSLVVGVLPNTSFLMGGGVLLVVLASAAGLTVSVAALVWRRRAEWALSAILFIALASAALAYSYVVPSAVWGAILSSYLASPPAEREARRQQLAEHWNSSHEDIQAHRWLLLSRRWGVCHELWPQKDCAVAPYPREAQGIARGRLTEVANGS